MTDQEKEAVICETVDFVVKSYIRGRHAVFLSHHSDDLFQVVFLALWESNQTDKIDWNSHYKSWLKKRAKGAIVDHFRTYEPAGYRRWSQIYSDRDVPKVTRLAGQQSRNEALVWHSKDIAEIDDMDNFEHLISGLLPKHKNVVRSRLVDDNRYAMIGKLFEMTESGARYCFLDAIQLLRICWADHICL